MRSQVQMQLLKLEGNPRRNTERRPAIKLIDVNISMSVRVHSELYSYSQDFQKTFGYGHLAAINTQLFPFFQRKETVAHDSENSFQCSSSQKQRQA